jgi:hypothetical protein
MSLEDDSMVVARRLTSSHVRIYAVYRSVTHVTNSASIPDVALLVFRIRLVDPTVLLLKFRRQHNLDYLLNSARIFLIVERYAYLILLV